MGNQLEPTSARQIFSAEGNHEVTFGVGASSLCEYGGYKRVREIFDLSRTLLWRLAREGKITSVSIRERNRLKGRRLYRLSSISRYLQSLEAPQA